MFIQFHLYQISQIVSYINSECVYTYINIIMQRFYVGAATIVVRIKFKCTNKIFLINNLRGPALRGLHGEEREHGGGHVIVVELLLGPHPRHHRRRLRLAAELEIFSLKNISVQRKYFTQQLSPDTPRQWSCCSQYSRKIFH